MMWVSIMQPYFFPYIGYFQLMAACDTFVVFDDVQYIRRGWVNRNRILVNGEPHWITMPVENADYYLPINQRNYLLDDRLALRLRRRIAGAYASAPQFDSVMPIIDEILSHHDGNVARFNTNLLMRIASYIGIHTPVRISSSIEKDRSLSGQELVIDLCRRLGASGYINPIGGLELYQASRFNEHGLELRFLNSTAAEYAQYQNSHVKSLSIIDVLMFNEPEIVKSMLSQYELIANKEHDAK